LKQLTQKILNNNIVRHIRSTALLNMAIKCGIVVLFFIISLWWLPAAYISGVLLALFILAEFNIKSIYYVLFFYPFRDSMVGFFLIALGIVSAIGIILFLVNSTKAEKKQYLLFFVVSTLYFIYLVVFTIPHFGHRISNFFLGTCFLFACLMNKDKLNLKSIVYWLIAGLLTSSIIGIMMIFIPGVISNADVSEFFGRNFSTHYLFGHRRFAGLTENTNFFDWLVFCGFAGLLVLNLQRKQKLWEFILLFTLLFTVGYSTISRTFVFAFAVIITVYAILKIIKERKKSLVTLGCIFVSTLIVVAAMFPYTVAIFSRLEGGLHEFDNWQEDVVDPGRLGIWIRYLNAWVSSPYTFFFGRGLSAPALGGMQPHNFYVLILANTGFFGLLFFIAFVGSLFYTLFKIQKLKPNLPAFFSLFVFLVIGMTQSLFPRILFFIFVIFFIMATKGTPTQEISPSPQAPTESPQVSRSCPQPDDKELSQE